MANILEFIIRARDEASKKLGKIDLSMGKVLETALGFSLANVGAMVGEEFREMVASAAELEGVEAAFRNLAEDAGKNADDFIAELKKMSGGLMTEGEIMKMTNQAILLGGKELADKLPTFMQVSQAAARATGQSFDYMFNSIITGTARGSKLILDNLGIMVDWQKAYDGYATSLGKTASALSEAEKAQARYNEVGRAAEEHLERLGVQEETTAEKMKKVGTAVAEAKTEIGKLILMGLDPLAEGFLWLKSEVEEASAAIDPGFVEDMEGLNIRLGEVGKEIYENRRRVREWKEQVGWAADVTELWEERLEDIPPAMDDVVKTARSLNDALNAMAAAKERIGMEFLEGLTPDVGAVQEVMDYLTRMAEADPRVLAAEAAVAAEREAGEETLAMLREIEAQREADMEAARTRLEETKAGLHGIKGAYDELAITTEDYEAWFVEPWKEAKAAIEAEEQAHQDRLKALSGQYASTQKAVLDPLLAEWQTYMANVKAAEDELIKGTMEEIKREWDGTVPTVRQILASWVTEGDIALADLTTSMGLQVSNMIESMTELHSGYERELHLMHIETGEVMPSMESKLIRGLKDPVEEAIDSHQRYRRELRLTDGEEVHTHVYEHRYIIYEGGGDPGDFPP